MRNHRNQECRSLARHIRCSGTREPAAPTAAFVNLCQTQGCPGASGTIFLDPSQVALDYGNFPFKGTDGRVHGSYFFAVVAPGYEDGGFADGAPGNLSDATPSTVPGDHGSGDTRADRTIVGGDQIPVFFPESHGTHDISFPPSQFMAIALSPFDTTPSGDYVLAVCPSEATSRCDCAFETFHIIRARDGGNASAGGATGMIDGGTTGEGGSTASGGAGGCGGSAGAAGSGGSAISGGAGGSGASGGAGGSGGSMSSSSWNGSGGRTSPGAGGVASMVGDAGPADAGPDACVSPAR